MKALIYENDLLNHFRNELASCQGFDIAMALITLEGLALRARTLILVTNNAHCVILFSPKTSVIY